MSEWKVGPLVCAALFLIVPASGGQENLVREGVAGHTGPGETDAHITRDVVQIVKAREAKIDQLEAERHEREKRALLAQEEAAEWARNNFWAVVGQTIVAGIALALLIVDLRQTRTSNERQLRAYLTFSDLTMLGNDGEKKVELKWQNNGQTPAFEVDAWANWALLDAPLPVEFEFSEPERGTEDGGTTVGVGGSAYAVAPGTLPNGYLTQVAEGKHLYIWGRVEYKDVFKRTRYTQIAAKASCEILKDKSLGVSWHSIDRHNRAA